MLRIELYKIFSRPRTYISFAVITAITFIIQLAMYVDGSSFVEFAIQGVGDQFDIQGRVLNGYLITYLILQSLLVQVPLLIALVAGDVLAGEANMGTLRLLLTKPISRTKVVWVKFVSSLVYALALLLWLAIIGLGASVLIFGTGDLINLKSDAFIMLLEDDVLWRYGAALAFAALAMATVAALSVFMSAFADNSVGPIIGTMGVIVVLTIFTNLELPLFNLVKPYLFTTHMVAWKGFFDVPVPYEAIAQSAIVLTIYIIGFVVATMVVFNKKDILS
ncbi:MAG: ABC transporter permease subunit [Chitinophagales bacterium]|nr:ABC transporter permease subunit [Chitinophagaceae bacterium]MCB9064490.1 ABC transporter permease subunit [Chitinophagales bacterium]